MYKFVVFSLLILPLLNAQNLQHEINNHDEPLVRQAEALNYLSNLPMRQYQDQMHDLSMDTASILDDEQLRMKRIYWENLAFHAADYDQKPKKG